MSWRVSRILSCEKTHASCLPRSQTMLRERASSNAPMAELPSKPVRSHATSKSNAFPMMDAVERNCSVGSLSKSSRRPRNSPASVDDWHASKALRLMRQPSGVRLMASDSTRPRTAAEAINGLPLAPLAMNSRASFGSAPAIDSASRKTSASERCPNATCIAFSRRSGWVALISSERDATKTSTWLSERSRSMIQRCNVAYVCESAH